jgi:hypothetical protein
MGRSMADLKSIYALMNAAGAPTPDTAPLPDRALAPAIGDVYAVSTKLYLLADTIVGAFPRARSAFN